MAASVQSMYQCWKDFSLSSLQVSDHLQKLSQMMHECCEHLFHVKWCAILVGKVDFMAAKEVDPIDKISVKINMAIP